MTERKDYAAGTKTSISTTEMQIKMMLLKNGAGSVGIIEDPGVAIVAFHLQGRAIRFKLPLPKRDDPKFVFMVVFGKVTAKRHPQSTQDNLWMQASKERWRQLHLCIKAKLESVAQEIETFDESFLAHVVMPDGQTIAEKVIPEMHAQLEGKPPRPLLGHG